MTLRPPSRPTAAGLLAILAIAFLAMNLRPSLVVVAPLLTEIRADLTMSRGVAGLLGATAPLAFALFGWVTPALAHRVGYERLAWMCMLLSAASQLARLLADGPALFVLFSFSAYAAMGMGNVLLPPLVKIHFPHAVGRVTATYILLISVGTAGPALLAVPVADAAGWRLSAGVWGIFALTAVYPWFRVHRTAAHHDAPGPGRATDSQPIRRLLRTPLAWGLAGVFGMNSLNAYAMMAWLPSMLVDAGISTSHAGVYLSLYAVVAIPLAVLVPWLATRTRSTFPLIIIFAACYASGYLGLLLAPTTGTLLWVMLAGAGPGSFPLVLTIATLRSSTVPGAAALSGFTQGVGYLLAGLGPLVVGLLRQASGTWTAPYLFLLCTLAAQLVAALLIARPGHIEEQLDRRRPAAS